MLSLRTDAYPSPGRVFLEHQDRPRAPCVSQMRRKALVDEARLAVVMERPLLRGAHDPDGKQCVMEAVAYVAGEEWSDHPVCASRVISAFLRNWNDNLADDDRQMLKPFIPRLVGTKASAAVEARRAWLATDWLCRVQAPAWLRLAKKVEFADALEGLTPALDAVSAKAPQPTLAAAWYAAKAAAKDAAGAAAWDAAGDAAKAAVGAAVGAAAGAAAWAAAWYAAGDAAWAGVGYAAWAAVGYAALAAAGAAALRPTVEALQKSALDLVDRMIECK